MRIKIINHKSIISLSYLLRWIVIALIMGISSSIIVNLFIILIKFINGGIMMLPIPLFLWTVGGAVLVSLVYSRAPGTVKESVPVYIRGINKNHGRIALRATLGKMLAALFTISFLGNGGVVGPLGRICAGSGSFLMSLLKRFKITEEDFKLACICGFSAGVAALFHSPIAAGILAVEITRKTGLSYRRLFPSILASSFTVFICRAAGLNPFYSFPLLQLDPEPLVLIPVFIMALFSGFLGRFFNVLYKFLSRYLGRRNEKLRLLRLIIIGGAVTLLTGLLNRGLVGTSWHLFDAVFQDTELLYGNLDGTLPLFLICLILLLVKILANSVIVASGYSAGFIGTMMLSGMLLGVAFSSLFGIEPYSADYFALVTAGFAGVLASCTNVPIAAAVLSAELFGFSFGMPAAVAAVVGFQINRHNTIYDQLL